MENKWVLPEPSKAWDYENGFYLTCDISRIAKILAHWELFKMAADLPGAIVECGVFKGASLTRFAMFRQLTGNPFSHRILGFDTFDEFPETEFEGDKKARERFVEGAGSRSISVSDLTAVLEGKGCGQNVELVAGDICKTVPEYLARHPELKIALLNLDTDIYEPAVTILEHLYPRLVKGGVLILDDYGTFPGETKAVDEHLAGAEIRKFPFAMTPCYVVK